MEEKVLVEGQFADAKVFKKRAIIFYMISGACYCIFLIFGSEQAKNVAALISLILMIPAIIMLIFSKIVSKNGITVTDKRVFGTAIFGKRVDLPIDKVSAVGMCMFNGIAVSTSSGTIKFLLCKNRDEVFDCISKVLLERQKATQDIPTVITQEISQSSADELKKFKDLFDNGVITEEEFEAKKKQLLGL